MIIKTVIPLTSTVSEVLRLFSLQYINPSGQAREPIRTKTQAAYYGPINLMIVEIIGIL